MNIEHTRLTRINDRTRLHLVYYILISNSQHLLLINLKYLRTKLVIIMKHIYDNCSSYYTQNYLSDQELVRDILPANLIRFQQGKRYILSTTDNGIKRI